MRRVVMSLFFALFAAGAASVLFAPQARTQAAASSERPNVFLIPQADGYGMTSCLSQNSECGRIVAQAWCESKGFAKVASYGVASPADITGSTGSRGGAAAEPPVLITCQP
jgi:hypothetical protein